MRLPPRPSALLSPFPLMGLPGLVLALWISVASPAFAEGEGELDEVSAKIKAQMEKIIQLMRENEQVLTEISTGKKDTPRKVDVDIPVPPDQDSQSPEAGKGSGDIEKAMEKMIRGQREAGSKIPGELEALVRMAPQMSSQGEGSGEPQPGEKGEDGKDPESEARDIRKQLEELKKEQAKKDGEKPDAGKPKHPRDPKQQQDPTGGKGDEAGKGAAAANQAPAWMVNLPPQIRDAWVRGDFDKVPAEYRDLIERYLIWLNRAAREEGPRTGNR